MEEKDILNLIKKSFYKEEKNLIVPLGDDACVYQANLLQVLTCDQLIEGVHFLTDSDPFLVGRKLLARSLSDIAAMGALPRYALCSLATRKKKSWLEAFILGLKTIAEEFKVSIVGGDCSSLPTMRDSSVFSLTLVGEVEKEYFARNTNPLIKAGDLIFVSGSLGNSISL